MSDHSTHYNKCIHAALDCLIVVESSFYNKLRVEKKLSLTKIGKVESTSSVNLKRMKNGSEKFSVTLNKCCKYTEIENTMLPMARGIGIEKKKSITVKPLFN